MKLSVPRLLAVDDEPEFLKLLRLNLGALGFEVLTAADAPHALKVLEEEHVDLVLLDIMLPGIDGMRLCQRLRENHPQLPIIMLSGRSLERDKVYALDMGADDYLVKPFGMDELLAGVRALLRRSRGASSTASRRFAFEGCVLDPDLHRLFFEDGQEIKLTPKENALLTLLVENAGKVLTHRTLLTSAWGSEYLDDHHYLWT